MSLRSEKLRHAQNRPVLSFGTVGSVFLFMQNAALAALVYFVQGSYGWSTSSVIAVALVLLLGAAGIFRNAVSRASLMRRREDAYRSARLAADRFEQAVGNLRHSDRTW